MIDSILKSVAPLLSELIPDTDARDRLRQSLLMAEHNASLAQIEVNKVEAAHASIWTSGWRPGIGWTCAAIFLWTYLLRDVAVIGLSVWVPSFDLTLLPQPDTGEIMPVLLGLLGLGGLRTFEKTKNLTR